MSCMMLDLLEIYVTACERQEQAVEEALKEVEALHLSLRTAQQHFPTADLAAKPALWSQMDADVDLALKTFKAIKVHFLTLDGITTTVFNPDRVALNFGPRNFGHLHNSARDSLLAFGAIRANMVAFVSEEEADTKRNMEEKLLHLGQVLNDQGLEPDKQALEDLEWQIWRAEILFLIYKGGLFKTATEHKEQIRYFSQQDLRELFSLPKEGFDVSLTQQQLYEEHDRQHTMDKYFKSHIEFLETQGIGGVSHHSLLFSKTAPLPVAVGVEEEVERIRGSSTVGSSFSSSLQERNVNGAEYAFKPKDVNINKKPSSPIDAGKLTESEIKQRINRLSQTLANKAMVSRLPDKGEKIQKQIGELNAELYRLGKVEAQGSERNVIDLEDITGEFQRVVI